MKKHRGIVLMMALALAIAAAPVEAEGKVDLVVLLDSSKSMFQYYNQVVDYVLTETVREYLRFGDSFHLVSFSDSTQLEIAQVLRTEPDLKSVIARLYLLYPLGRNTDLVTALKNVYRYVDGLPSQNTKHIILITDGMHSPAAGTPYASLDVPGVRTEIDGAAVKIRERGWTMRIVRVPFTASGAPSTLQDPSPTSDASVAGGASGAGGATAAGGTPSGSPAALDEAGEAASSSPGSGDYLATVAEAVGQEIQTFDPANRSASVKAGVDLHRIEFYEVQGDQDYSFSLQAAISNGSELTVPIELTGLLLEDGTDILFGKASAELSPGTTTKLTLKVRLPDTIPEGQTRLLLEPRFKDGLRVSPARSTVNLVLKKSSAPAFLRSAGGGALFLSLLLVACGAIIAAVLYLRHAHRKAEEPIVNALLDSASRNRSGSAAGEYPQPGNSVVIAQATHHASPYSARAELQSRAGNQASGLQATVDPRDTAAGRSALLAAANDPDARARKRLELLESASNQHHAIPAQNPAESGIPGRDMTQAASLLGTWKTPGSGRKTLPLAAEGRIQAHEGSRRPPMPYEPRISRPGAVRLVLHVQDQNPNVGKRNIRAMHAGGRASVGGGKSAFLIFLLPVPRTLAYLFYDGIDATLVPQKPEFFPDYDSPIQSCIGRDIRVVTTKGKELFIRFERYVPPLEKINKLLHCLETPGMIAVRTDLYSEQDRPAEQVQGESRPSA